LSGCRIDVGKIVESLDGSDPAVRWIVEGAGGALVPINEREMMADLMKELGMPILVAARTAVGTINHTLMTLEALQRRSIEVAGIVLVGSPDPHAREAIEARGRVPVLGEMPRFDPLTFDALAAWVPDGLDPAGTLLAHL
jgi:dethiobiotin synthetase